MAVRKHHWRWLAFGVAAGLLIFIPTRLFVAKRQAPQPQAIFVLGGHPDREKAAAQLAKYYPELEVWVSSGSDAAIAHSTFLAVGISDNRLHLDYRASDTVTNFTTLVQTFKSLDIQHVWLVTSDFHMDRAEAIAYLVLGSHGITYTTHIVPSNRAEEPTWKIGRDAMRSAI